MPHNSSPSFITEIALTVDSRTEKELLARFQAARQLYNACLNEAMERLELMRKSELYQGAKQLPKSQKKLRTEAFKKARTAYCYSDYDLQAYASVVSKSSKWIALKLDSNTQQTLATRAFRASDAVLFGKAKKVRYKVPTRFRSVEGKTNKQGIRWKDGHLIWGNLKIRAVIPNNPVILHGLSIPIKYVRLLWRELNGKRRWFAQLVCGGTLYVKPNNYVGDGVIGLDLNISNIAFVGDSHAGLLPFAPDVPTKEKEIGRLQRKMERSRRSCNPQNYHPSFIGYRGRKTITKKGQPKKGRQQWHNSKTYQRTAAKKRELERRKTAYAKTQNRKLVNEILRHGKVIKTENVSIKGWQKRYGKAISAKSPSFVQSELCRKAENAGGQFIKFSTQKTALSQTHLTGERVKKSLSQHIHYDITGVVMHRDLFSAFLSRHIYQESLSVQDAQLEYPKLEPVLLSAWKASQTNGERVGVSESRQSDTSLEPFDNWQSSGNPPQLDKSQWTKSCG